MKRRSVCTWLVALTLVVTLIPTTNNAFAGNGACCLPDGSCTTAQTEFECDDLGGVWHAQVNCASVECPPSRIGACCTPPENGACFEVTEEECEQALGGTFQGVGTECIPGVKVCQGACCVPDGSCVPDQAEFQCDDLGGVWHALVDCASVACPPSQIGACCTPPENGACFEVTEQECEQALGGTFQGVGTECIPGVKVCQGACCVPDGSCVPDQAEFQCDDVGGVWHALVDCASVACPPSQIGACCTPPENGACFEVTEEECEKALGGTFQGVGTECIPGVKVCQGACCVPDGSCVPDQAEFQCDDVGGVWHALVDCASVACPPSSLGACCINDTCFLLTEAECEDGFGFGGTFFGVGTNCIPGQKTCLGACCLPDGTCANDQAAFECDEQGGVWSAFNDCNDTPLAGAGLRFDGGFQVGADHAVGDLSALLSGDTSFTISFWLKALVQTHRVWILDVGHRDTMQDVHFLIQTDGFTQFGFFGGGAANKNIFDFQPFYGTWVHVATVYEQPTNTLRSYVDGVLQDETTPTLTPDVQSGPDRLRIAMPVEGDSPFRGLLDEIRVWNVSRTAGQIQADRLSTLVGDEPGLVAYYRLDEGAGMTAADATGGNDLTLIDGPAWLVDCLVPCPADTDGNGAVDADDLVNVILDWGTDGSSHGGDVDGTGTVDTDDLVLVILGWGPCV